MATHVKHPFLGSAHVDKTFATHLEVPSELLNHSIYDYWVFDPVGVPGDVTETIATTTHLPRNKMALGHGGGAAINLPTLTAVAGGGMTVTTNAGNPSEAIAAVSPGAITGSFLPALGKPFYMFFEGQVGLGGGTTATTFFYWGLSTLTSMEVAGPLSIAGAETAAFDHIGIRWALNGTPSLLVGDSAVDAAPTTLTGFAPAAGTTFRIFLKVDPGKNKIRYYCQSGTAAAITGTKTPLVTMTGLTAMSYVTTVITTQAVEKSFTYFRNWIAQRRSSTQVISLDE